MLASGACGLGTIGSGMTLAGTRCSFSASDIVEKSTDSATAAPLIRAALDKLPSATSPLDDAKGPLSEMQSGPLACKNQWLGGKDSNLDKQIQSLPSYRWTTPQQK